MTNTALSADAIRVKSGQVIGHMVDGAFICSEGYRAPEPPKGHLSPEMRKQFISAIDETAQVSSRDSGYDRPCRITCRASRGQCRLFG